MNIVCVWGGGGGRGGKLDKRRWEGGLEQRWVHGRSIELK